jgi:Zn-dependent protease with chaperone function
MNMFLLKVVIFVLIFITLCNWFQILRFSKLIIGPKIKTKSIDDRWIKSVVKKKSGLKLLDITLFKDKKMYGMMAGLPFWPKMILSEGLYNNFNKNELEWVILHEAGHCVLWHNLQAFFVEMVILTLGVYSIWITDMNLLFVFLLSLLASFICIQIIRWGIEYMADKYSIDRVTNPRGVITAQDKFRKNYNGNPFSDERSILRFLLHWNIYPSKRIEMAKSKIS